MARSLLLYALSAALACASAVAQDDRGHVPATEVAAPQLAPPPPPVRPATNEPWLGDDGRPVRPAPAVLADTSAPPLPPALAAVTASVRPERVAPGQRGIMFITTRLQDLSVLRPQDGPTLQYERQQGDLALGQWSVSEARGKAPGLPGIAVHAETAVVEIPFTVGAAAGAGPRAIRLYWSAELYDGDAGKSLGRFGCEVTAAVTVVVSNSAGVPAPAVVALVPRIQQAAPVTSTAPVLEQPESDVPTDTPDAFTWLLGAAGVLALGIGLLVVRRAR